MKQLFLIPLTLLLAAAAYSQPCATGGKIQSPAVAKLTEAQSTVTNNCNAVTISWRGSQGQSYIVAATYTDQATGKVSSAEGAWPIACDNAFNCTVTIELKQGSSLSWSVQAVQAIDGRTFYSYPLRGETPGCEQPLIAEKNAVTVSKASIKATEAAPNNAVSVFPNPVTGELTINWTGEYRGKANLAILDASGKPVNVMDIRKEQPSYMTRLAVQGYSSGVYIIYIGMHNGRSVSTRFVKN
jgi:hypothetical protein